MLKYKRYTPSAVGEKSLINLSQHTMDTSAAKKQQHQKHPEHNTDIHDLVLNKTSNLNPVSKEHITKQLKYTSVPLTLIALMEEMMMM